MPRFRRFRKALLVLATLSAASPVTINRSGALRASEACAQAGRCCAEQKSICTGGEYVLFDRYRRSEGQCESLAS